MAFNKTDLDNIKSKIPISTELEKKTKLVKKGKDIWCCCPFHNEKTPSCKINDDYGTFYCFGCGAKGDIFTVYQDLFNYTFLDAVYSTLLGPFFGAGLPLIALLAAFVAVLNAVLALLMVPFLPYEVLAFNALTPLETILLNVDLRLGFALAFFSTCVGEVIVPI